MSTILKFIINKPSLSENSTVSLVSIINTSNEPVKCYWCLHREWIFNVPMKSINFFIHFEFHSLSVIYHSSKVYWRLRENSEGQYFFQNTFQYNSSHFSGCQNWFALLIFIILVMCSLIIWILEGQINSKYIQKVELEMSQSI